jgi:hypothetical protein
VARIDFDKTLAAYRRAEEASDRAWEAYRKAREKLARRRGTFAAEQGAIDAGLAVAKAQSKLDERETELRSACFQRATDELTSSARARLPFKAPTLEERKTRMEDMMLCLLRGGAA